MRIRRKQFGRTPRWYASVAAAPAARPAVMEPLERKLLLAGVPTLAAGVMIQDGASPMEVAVLSLPSVADWNHDGRKDLLVGQYTNGNIWRFLNQGTDPTPTFNSGSRVQSGGVDITTSFG